ncbi:MAG: SHOCT-like domain-containing protein [Thermoleophilia bacterium]
MNGERTRILGMLAEGKITAQDAELLLDAIQTAPGPQPTDPADAEQASGPRKNPKYMYVKVRSTDGDNVDVKVPLALARAGLKLTSLIPPLAMAEIDRHMGEQGVSIDFANLKPDDIEELIEGLTEMEVNVDSKNGDNVRVYCA